MTTILRHEDFAPYVDQPFRFSGWHGSLRLARIDLPARAGASDARAPFTLIFHGMRGEVMAEGLRTATAEDGSSFEFYIMPIHTPAADRQDYQAVFN
ncbi:MAG: hypothetical protein JO339_37010 [Alphaproteobacteria bacterium]|nr:hypothetical protein [Alphaproteobacteria bacterium]